MRLNNTRGFLSMSLTWTDSQELALALIEQHPDVDPIRLHFTELRQWILDLNEFNDDPKHCGEKVLEAVQMAWIDEMD
jgi:FeS assembly protein IscX